MDSSKSDRHQTLHSSAGNTDQHCYETRAVQISSAPMGDEERVLLIYEFAMSVNDDVHEIKNLCIFRRSAEISKCSCLRLLCAYYII
jgi:hypothetical protein